MKVDVNDTELVDRSFSSSTFKTLEESNSIEALFYDYSLLPSFMLTTKDNPFDPFKDFDGWYQWDEAHGYCTCGLIARIVKKDNCLTERDQQISIAIAIDSVLTNDPFGFYELVAKEKER